MLKCRDCFFGHLPAAWVPSIRPEHQPSGGYYKPKAEQEEEALIALGQSRTADLIFNGDALCAEHAVYRYRNA